LLIVITPNEHFFIYITAWASYKLYLDTLSWFWSKQYLLLLLKDASLVEK